MVDSDIRAMVHKLDQKIAKLNQIRTMLLEEFGESNESAGGVEFKSGLARPVASTPFKKRRVVPKKGPTRKDELILLLREDGPCSRQEMVKGTGMPIGTVSYLLNDKATFYRLQDGKWDLTEAAKKAILEG